MQRATLTVCRNCPRVVCGELKLAGVRAQTASRWDMWKPRFKKPIPTEDEKNLIEQNEEEKRKIAKSIGEVEFDVVKALDKSYDVEKYDIFGRGGLTDPYDLAIEDQGDRGSSHRPVLVPSVESSRIIGCVCEKDLKEIKWMRIERGQQKRCECGNWFKMIDVRPDKSEDL